MWLFARPRPCSLGSSVPQRDGNCSAFLSGLHENRKLETSAVCFQANHIAILQGELLCQFGCYCGIVSPRNFTDRVGKFLQPGIVRMMPVAQSYALIQVQFIWIGWWCLLVFF